MKNKSLLTSILILFIEMFSVAQVTGAFTDSRDSKTYKSVKIGTQTWMAENLNYLSENSWCYDNNSSYGSKCGRLYDYETAKKVCPSGWHLPSDAEWTILTDNLGGEGVAGDKMKSTVIWDNNGNGYNSSGFTGLPGGFRSHNGAFSSIRILGFWWSSTESNTYSAWYRYLSYDDGEVGRSSGSQKLDGLSVRCLRD